MKKSLQKININDFDYNLPENIIAKFPLINRDEAKLLILNNKQFSSDIFYNISNYFNFEDLIIFNDTKVINARLIFEKETGSKIEIFCLEPIFPNDYYSIFEQTEKCKWKCFVGNNKKWKNGILSKNININEKKAILNVTKISTNNKSFEILFEWNNNEITFSEILNNFGEIPIPPYLNRNSQEIDRSEYQTVFGKFEGSVAAPTAGLHFTKKVFNNLKEKKVNCDFVTLHVGAGTFQPVKTDDATEHIMHSEQFIIKKSTIENIIKHFGNICAVGTTTVRTIESLYIIGTQVFNNNNIQSNSFTISQFEPYNDDIILEKNATIEILQNLLNWMNRSKFEFLNCSTQIMIVPNYKFKIINSLITNFHQPKSTLLLLLAAFVGNDWKKMYEYAIENNFRFLSYGDCCLIK